MKAKGKAKGKNRGREEIKTTWKDVRKIIIEISLLVIVFMPLGYGAYLIKPDSPISSLTIVIGLTYIAYIGVVIYSLEFRLSDEERSLAEKMMKDEKWARKHDWENMKKYTTAGSFVLVFISLASFFLMARINFGGMLLFLCSLAVWWAISLIAIFYPKKTVLLRENEN